MRKWRRIVDYVMLVTVVVLITMAIRYFGLSEFSGRARAVDGDSLIINNSRVRLYGIDAPELHQKCKLADGTVYPCGLKARQKLRELIGNADITCTRIDIDRYQRDVSECMAGDVNLNKTMVRTGWAVAYVSYSPVYKALENRARAQRLGLWRGSFVKPGIWRKMNR